VTDDDDNDDYDDFIKGGKCNPNFACLISYLIHCRRVQTSNGSVYCIEQQSQCSKSQIYE
jgi:hypothetical protein